jgi:phosphoribosylformylglycinamidine cyclo-ligase
VSSSNKSSTYKAAGVDIDAGDRFVDAIKPLAKATSRSEVIGGIGGFGALFKLNLQKYSQPVLVSSTDGVGTKLRIAFLMDKHDTIGIDLVAMSVNDLIVQGAEPLFFLDYLSCGKLTSIKPVDIVKGIADGCKESQCALVGGETAEMPDSYPEGEYDLAGFAVGVVDADKMIDGSSVRHGHVLIGIASSGLHSNGFSLARKVFLKDNQFALDKHVDELGRTLGEELLTPTRIYARTVAGVLRDLPVHAMAHITGGGVENIPRVLPQSCRAVIDHGSWPWLPVFKMMQELGNIEQAEMYRTFNCGIGLVMAVPQAEAGTVLDRLRSLGEQAWAIGRVEERKGQNDPRVVVV